MEFVDLLEQEFKRKADVEIAEGQNSYMRNKFVHFGIKAGPRRDISKPFLTKEYLPSKKNAFEIAKILWLKPQREFHHFAMDLLLKYKKNIEEEDIYFFEYLIINNSWWDTVDVIAPKLISTYFKKFPKNRDQYLEKWINSGNIWLQRSCLIFQLMAKKEMDTACLSQVILKLNNTNEFFINKAIGWVLRQYSKTNPNWVLEFAENNKLKPLSYREAVRLMK